MNRAIARLLTSFYPREWRDRYGGELKELLETGRGGFRVSADVVFSAVREHIDSTQGGNMNGSTRSLGSVMRQPSAFLPVAMSVTALVMVLGYVARYGGGPVQDEGSVGHLWQLLMVLQAPIVAVFAIKWLPRAPRPTMYVLVQQFGAALASFAAVFFFNLG